MKSVKLAVNGTLMRGLALNRNLLDAGAVFVYETCTAPKYRLWSINDAYPAMQRDENSGSAISLEIWELPVGELVDLLNKEPPGLTLGQIELADGARVLGILGEAFICACQSEITAWGGWREYMNSR